MISFSLHREKIEKLLESNEYFVLQEIYDNLKQSLNRENFEKGIFNQSVIFQVESLKNFIEGDEGLKKLLLRNRQIRTQANNEWNDQIEKLAEENPNITSREIASVFNNKMPAKDIHGRLTRIRERKERNRLN